MGHSLVSEISLKGIPPKSGFGCIIYKCNKYPKSNMGHPLKLIGFQLHFPYINATESLTSFHNKYPYILINQWLSDFS